LFDIPKLTAGFCGAVVNAAEAATSEDKMATFIVCDGEQLFNERREGRLREIQERVSVDEDSISIRLMP
jgi:hypothetical protein